MEPVLIKNLLIHLVVQTCSQQAHATGWSLKIREKHIVMRETVSGTLEGGPEMLQGQKKLYVCKMITGIELTHFYTRITPPRYYELH